MMCAHTGIAITIVDFDALIILNLNHFRLLHH